MRKTLNYFVIFLIILLVTSCQSNDLENPSVFSTQNKNLSLMDIKKNEGFNNLNQKRLTQKSLIQ